MPDLTPTTGGEPARRSDPFAVQSAPRVAAWGRLQADDCYAQESLEEWRARQPKLILGPELAGRLISHAANMAFKLGRRLNTEELTWTYEATYHTRLARPLWNNLLAYGAHEEVERAIKEWLARLRRPQVPFWAKRAAEQWSFAVPMIRSDVALCPPLNGHRLRPTGNEDIDRALAGIHADMDKRYTKASAKDRTIFEQTQAKLSIVSVETKHEVAEKISTQQRMFALEGKVDDMVRRLEGKGRNKE